MIVEIYGVERTFYTFLKEKRVSVYQAPEMEINEKIIRLHIFIRRSKSNVFDVAMIKRNMLKSVARSEHRRSSLGSWPVISIT